MHHEVLEIKPRNPGYAVPAQPARMTTYVLENSPEIDPGRKRPAVVLFPGGGYAMTSDREAEPVALQLNAMGFHCFILRYSVAPSRFPTALLEAMEAVATVRERAEEWNVAPGKVLVMGFSAGGHLAASAGCLWENQWLGKEYGVEGSKVRPDGMILCYAVLTSGVSRHPGSFENLLGGREDLMDLVSMEKQVTANTPPAFLWHTADDDAVPVENSLLMSQALQSKGVSFELHIYPSGVHGLSLATEESARSDNAALVNPACQSWTGLLGTWIHGL